MMNGCFEVIQQPQPGVQPGRRPVRVDADIGLLEGRGQREMRAGLADDREHRNALGVGPRSGFIACWDRGESPRAGQRAQGRTDHP